MIFISLRANLANKYFNDKNKMKKIDTVEPPLTVNSPQQPFFRGGGGEQSMH